MSGPRAGYTALTQSSTPGRWENPCQGVQGQAPAHGRVAGHQKLEVFSHKPAVGLPGGVNPLSLVRGRLQRQHKFHFALKTLTDDSVQAAESQLVVQTRIKRVDVDR